jgi:hypothetical protein
MGDLRIERDRTEAEWRTASLRRDPPGTAQKYLGTVFNGGSMPTANPAWYLTNPTQVSGAETEGASFTTELDTGTQVPVLVLGSAPAVVGDILPARMISGVWVAERGSSSSEGCHCVTNICVVSCAGTAIIGASVTVDGGSPVTTAAGGCCSVNLCPGQKSGAKSHQVRVTAAGFYPYSNTVSLSCAGTYTVKMLPTSGAGSVIVSAFGCCCDALPGATVAIAGDTYTTDSSGQVTLGFTEAGTYPWTISKARFNSCSGSVTITSNCAVGATASCCLTVAAGFACVNSGTVGSPVCCFPDPVPTTLNLTDSVAGGCSLTYDGTQFWNGSVTFGFAGFAGLGAQDYTMTYQYPGVPSCGGANKCQSVSIGMTGPLWTPNGPPNTTGVPCGISGVVDYNYNTVTGDLNNPCDCTPVQAFGQIVTECCGNAVTASSCCESSGTFISAVPLDFSIDMVGCGTAAFNPLAATWTTSTPSCCCYGAGAAPTITVTE